MTAGPRTSWLSATYAHASTHSGCESGHVTVRKQCYSPDVHMQGGDLDHIAVLKSSHVMMREQQCYTPDIHLILIL
jgi:hypothetical protein